MTNNEIQAKARELRELKAMAEELTAEITAIEDTIKAELTARCVEEMTAGEYKIRWTTVTSNRFDSSTFKKVLPDLYSQYCKPTVSRRFSVA